MSESAWDAAVEGEGDPREQLADVRRRLAEVEARLEALDASYVRHQGQNEDDLRHARDDTERVRTELDHHLGATR